MWQGGSDRLFAKHYIHADSRLTVLLSTFFTSALTHGHVPDAFMQSILVPVIKNKSGDSSDVNNYRPIALVTIALAIGRNGVTACRVVLIADQVLFEAIVMDSMLHCCWA